MPTANGRNASNQNNHRNCSAPHHTFFTAIICTTSSSIGTTSAPDPVGDGTLELLDHLPPKPRALYVEKLSKEEVIAIVIAAWKERDAARTQSVNQGMRCTV
jgi:hypothetical protein